MAITGPYRPGFISFLKPWSAALLSVLLIAGARWGAAQDGTGDAAPATSSSDLHLMSDPAAPKTVPQGVLLLDGDLNVRPESLFCGGEYVRGTLRDSSAGLPAQIVAGALVGAENLECVGVDETVLPDMLRVITSVEHTTGSADFTLTTRNLASECEPSGTAVTGLSVGSVCAFKERLPMATMITSSVKSSGFTHSLHLSIAQEDLQLPGIGVEDVYLVYAVSPSVNEVPDPSCSSDTRIDVMPWVVNLTAPFYFCARVCPKPSIQSYVQESDSLPFSVSAPATDVEDEDERNGEDSPLNFVDDGADAQSELAEEEDNSFRLTRSEIGLIVSSVVCSVLFVIIGFVVVCKCTSFSQRASMISPYLKAVGAANPEAGTAPAVYSQPQPMANSLYPAAPLYVAHNVALQAPPMPRTANPPKTPRTPFKDPPLKYSQVAMSSPQFAAAMGTPKRNTHRIHHELPPSGSHHHHHHHAYRGGKTESKESV